MGLRLLIDTDPGVDDGVALLMALGARDVAVEAISVVHGNTAVATGVRNARLVLETAGVDLPVYAGAQAPLVRPAVRRPAWIHGEDGFGDLGRVLHRTDAEAGFAPDVVVRRALADPGELSLVALGPLTNIALAVAREPDFAGAVKELIVAGGATALGNVSPVAEFNIHADPEAARVVFAAGFRLTLVPIELCRFAARLTAEDLAPLKELESERVALARALLGHSAAVAARRPALPGEQGVTCPDGVAMAVALTPDVLTDAVAAYVDVETAGALTTGMTVVDRLGVWGKEANARVGYGVDAAGWKRVLQETLG